MALLKCSMCGGEMELTTDSRVAICQHCDSKIVIPKDLEEKGNEYKRAVTLRQDCNFDKAAIIYEEILKKDDTNADAYWGLVLCKYGIEYVVNKANGERHPTCHRTHSVSILADPDYKAALEHYDAEAAAVIEEQAKQINEIQRKIIEISRKEEPYDIFICYKESEGKGDDKVRTNDSVIAQDIYAALVKQGYKVFFARKTLENKLGSEFEPVIYAALSSAKVMVVLGTKAEYFNAVWVRNEWSRFIKMKEESKEDKIIIPVYKDISASELPPELNIYQSLDMGKVGFLQDLTDGIERCLRKNVVKDEPKQSGYVNADADMHQRHIKNAETYIRLQNYTEAEKHYKAVVNDFPDDYMGWWGLIVCATKEFTDFSYDADKVNTWYKYVRKLAAPEQVARTDKLYVPYLKKIAAADAEKEIEKVRRTVKDHNSGITDNQQKIHSYNRRLEAFENEYKSQDKLDKQNIAKGQKTLKSHQGLRLRKIIGLGVFLVCFLLAVLLFIIGIYAGVGEVIAAGAVIGFIGFVSMILSPKSTFRIYGERIKRADDYLNECIACQKRNKDVYDNTVTTCENNVREANKEIMLLKMKITACNNYLALGNAKIQEFCYALRCASCGIPVNVDATTKELRDLAHGYKKIVVTEQKKPVATNVATNTAPVQKKAEPVVKREIICEYCDNRIVVGPEEEKTGIAVCQLCGGKNDVK